MTTEVTPVSGPASAQASGFVACGTALTDDGVGAPSLHLALADRCSNPNVTAAVQFDSSSLAGHLTATIGATSAEDKLRTMLDVQDMGMRTITV